MPRRSPETLADYLAVALCPALIMLLVGSLMWFLVEVFYQGEYKLRLLWVLAMFVIGIVGIARIAMEEGRAYAAMFGWALGAAVALALAKFVQDGLFIGGPLLLLVWWAAHKLTWDCTLLDDTQDASGAGLLQQMGLEPGGPWSDGGPAGTTPTRRPLTSDFRPPTADAPPSALADRPEAFPTRPWWETFLEPDRRPHAPGVWVIWFSLAALPLFGLGGWFVPASDPVRRARVFGLLVIYVASALGLLLATSFLGLRRYLRQRKLDMPTEMTTTWIVAGVVMICATLLVAAVLPRPTREYSLSQLPFAVTSAVRRASRLGAGPEGTQDTTSPQAAQQSAPPGQQPSGSEQQRKISAASQASREPQQGADRDPSGARQPASGKSSQAGNHGASGKQEKSSTQSQEKSDTDPHEPSSAASQPQSRQDPSQNLPPRDNNGQPPSSGQQRPPPRATPQPAEQSPGQQRPADASPPPPSSPPLAISQITSLAGASLLTLARWLFYLGLLITALVLAWIYRVGLAAAWQKLLAELRELWDRWLGQPKTTAGEAAAATGASAPPRPFAAFANPFLTGEAARMPWPRLVRYTFEALEAFGREQSCPRDPGQTALEYAQSVAAIAPEMAGSLQLLAAWYSQLAFAPQAPTRGSPDALRDLWHAMSSRSAAA